MATPIIQFTKLEDTSAIISFLMNRLPRSANVYNMALSHSKFQQDMTFYFHHTQIDIKDNSDNRNTSRKIGDDTWIIATYNRPDYGLEISISAPKDPFSCVTQTQIQNGFLSSNMVNWESPYVFNVLELSISQIFFELSCRILGHVTTVVYSYYYFMHIAEIEAIEVDMLLKSIRDKKETKETEVKSLHSISGIEFFVKNWDKTLPGTERYLAEVLKVNPSSGVLVNGEIVSGVLLNASGFMGMLSTLNEFRRKGFGKLAMQSLIMQLGSSGYIPCSVVARSNDKSNAFHKQLGLKISHSAECIYKTDKLIKHWGLIK